MQYFVLVLQYLLRHWELLYHLYFTGQKEWAQQELFPQEMHFAFCPSGLFSNFSICLPSTLFFQLRFSAKERLASSLFFR